MKFSIADQTLELNAIEAATTFERIESAVGLKTSKPTLALLDSLVDWLDSLGIKATRTAAWAVWWALYEHLDQIGKRTAIMADLAFWYGVDPFQLDEHSRTALWCNLPRVKAQQQLHDGKFDSTNYKQVYQLVLQATGDEQQARKAQADALERFVEASIAKARKGR
jgi:hypothetical protein